MNLSQRITATLAPVLILFAASAFATNNPVISKEPSGDKEMNKKKVEATAEPEPVRMPSLSIEPPMNTDELAIIPNPTEAEFKFSYYMPGIDILHIRLEDEMGVLLHQMEIGGHEEMYNLPFKFWQYPDGVYYLEVETELKTFKRRIVKADYED